MTHQAYQESYTILRELLDSAALDLSTEASDCLEVFNQYDWEMQPGCDEFEFQCLRDKGNSGSMTEDELDEFMEMVSRDGQTHIYFSIYQGHRAIKDYNNALLADSVSSTPAPVEEYKVVALSTGHLTEADRDALADAINDGDHMVLQRESGFFLKLYEENTCLNLCHGHSESIKEIIQWAHKAGYLMLEFDADAMVLPQFPVYDW